jgi:hypothetical protein
MTAQARHLDLAGEVSLEPPGDSGTFDGLDFSPIVPFSQEDGGLSGPISPV